MQGMLGGILACVGPASARQEQRTATLSPQVLFRHIVGIAHIRLIAKY
jgi:hypothetical protein